MNVTPTTAAEVVLSVEHLQMRYGTGPTAHLAVEDVTFDVTRGQLTCVVGPSGAGKTTLLKCIAGLQAPTGGRVVFEGAVVTDPPTGMSVVFQDYGRSLFPWMTVFQNVTFPLDSKGMKKREAAILAKDVLTSVGLIDFTNSYPWQLSGGMQQRVAIARALAFQPDLLLMDEPFASLDAQTRAELEDLTLGLCDRFNVTIVFITHDIDEAVYLGDQVVVLSNSPSRVDRVFTVNLPKPRDQVATKALPEFTTLRTEVAGRIHRHLAATTTPNP